MGNFWRFWAINLHTFGVQEISRVSRVLILGIVTMVLGKDLMVGYLDS